MVKGTTVASQPLLLEERRAARLEAHGGARDREEWRERRERPGTHGDVEQALDALVATAPVRRPIPARHWCPLVK